MESSFLFAGLARAFFRGCFYFATKVQVYKKY